MKNFVKLCLYLSIFILTQNPSMAKIENKIVLKVENEIISNYEVKNKILSSLILNNQEINQKNIDNIKKQALESLILFKLKKIELSKYNFKNNPKQINEYLNLISSNDVATLKDKFEKNNLDYALFLEEIETQFKWQQFIYKIYSNKIKIDENSINLEIENLANNQKKIEEFRISEIEVLLNNNDKDKETILEIKENIKSEGFELTAIKYSTSLSSEKRGDLGWINSKSLSPRIYSIVSKMKIGEISEPILSQNSLLFLKIVDKRLSEPKKIDLVKLRENLINNKKNELFNLYSRSHLSKLKNTSLIEYK
tara:strand:+ start:163 stop:1092 length:930 start_codon:yes stop_codon:yes gene_type:complete